ncbi:MAG: DNA polymerase III subunit delta [Thiobacillaceae bacterium]
MRIRPEQLEAHLQRGLAPVYVISGDEPLLTDETAASIRAALRRAGVSERQSFQADSGFDWAGWLAGFDSLSLFASRRLVELRLPTGKPGAEGGRALESWCARPPADTWLLVLLPRLDRAGQAAKWFTALDEAGVVVTPQPPSLAELPAWIGARLARHGLKAEKETLEFLAARVEGNLLAAHQEIEKLALLLAPGPVRLDDAREAVLDVARYDAGQLPEALLKGDGLRLLRILEGLKQEGEIPILALWILTQEIRTLYRLASGLERGETLARACARLKVWESRRPLIARALQRLDAPTLARALAEAARIDRAAKGLEREDAWEMLKRLGLALTGLAGARP